jgi:hypothetical protein
MPGPARRGTTGQGPTHGRNLPAPIDDRVTGLRRFCGVSCGILRRPLGTRRRCGCGLSVSANSASATHWVAAARESQQAAV